MATLAVPADVEVALGRPLNAAETTRADGLLRRASSLVIGYTRQDFADSVPDAVVDVVADMVGRVISQGEIASGIESTTEAAGPFTRGFKFGGGSSGGVWLSSADKIMLRPHRLGGGVSSVRLVGERYDVTDEA